jgi:hypothetical protein
MAPVRTWRGPALVSLLGAALVLYATAPGLGISADSVRYLQAARSLRAGDGLRALDRDAHPAPLTHYPPLYPTLLAATPAPLTFARGWNALAFAAWLFLFARAFGWGAGLLAASAPDVLGVHVWAWSEPTFLLLTAVALAVLRRSPAAAGLLLGAAALTRYAALPLPLAAAFALGRDGRGRDAARLLALAWLPVAAWGAWSLAATGLVADRRIGFHPPGLDGLWSGLRSLSSWVLAPPESGAIRWVIAAGSVVIGARAVSDMIRERAWPRGPLPLWGAVYLAFVLLTMTFADAATQLEVRILAPLHPMAIAAAGSVLLRLRRRAALAALLGTLGATHVATLAVELPHARREGLGYSARAFRESPLLEAVQGLPAERPLCSSAAEALQFWTGRPVADLPWKQDLFTGREVPRYEARLAALLDRLRAEAGAIVLWDLVHWRDYQPGEAELLARLPLEVRLRVADGALLTPSRP